MKILIGPCELEMEELDRPIDPMWQEPKVYSTLPEKVRNLLQGIPSQWVQRVREKGQECYCCTIPRARQSGPAHFIWEGTEITFERLNSANGEGEDAFKLFIRIPKDSSRRITLRPYRPEECEDICKLFYRTVHTVNRADYTEEQLDAWAPVSFDQRAWADSLAQHDTVVAEIDGQVVGFADLDGDSHFDRLYVSSCHQGMGIAARLSQWVEEKARQKGAKWIQVEASITAKPFFTQRGYRLIARQEVQRRGVVLINYRMEKRLDGEEGQEKKGAEIDGKRENICPQCDKWSAPCGVE